MISSTALTAAALVRSAASELNCETAMLDSEVLFRHATGWTRTDYIANATTEVSPAVAAKFKALIARRKAYEPVAYITGYKEFFGREFFVDKRVLVPRPETELLVEEALKFLATKPKANVLELATGSGCVAVSVAIEAGEISSFMASDISPDALDVAAVNFARHGLIDKIQLCSSDWFSSIAGRFDLIIANPPYVETGAELAPDLGFEPKQALFSGPDGLKDIRIILSQAHRHLMYGGQLLFEFGAGQESEISKLAPSVQFICDLSGRPRVARVEG